jgi:murein DD-endopeptidase MepM/ murein hydrolase activator NlpD
MAYSYTPKLDFPLVRYRVNDYKFRQKTFIKKIFWGIHLGKDIKRPKGTQVKSIGRGKVIYSALHPGTKKKGNWGNIIIIAHKNPRTKKVFFSLYAHLGKKLVRKGQKVELGKIIGIIGKKNTAENGWWPSHLHFGIYVGPWEGKVLPGYWKRGQKRTKISCWKEPTKFIRNYK